MAMRVREGDWRNLLPGESLEPICETRTSPAGPVRIDLQLIEICLAGDTITSFNLPEQRIVLNSGRVRVHLDGKSSPWTVVAGTRTFRCAPGSEVEFSFAETLGVNLLRETIQVTGPDNNATELVAPLQWAANEEGFSRSAIPDAQDWGVQIRKRTEPRAAQGLGQLLATDGQSKSPVRLEVAQYHVNISLKVPLALVQIDQSFFNRFTRQEEGTFIFNLPDGASISRFAMYVSPTELIEGELIDRTWADQVYRSIVSKKRDPAILEQIGANLFRIRIFPILAHDTKRILLDYTVPLDADRGRYHFELPLMSDLKPVWDFEMKGVISAPFATNSVISRSHPALKFNVNSHGDLAFAMQESDYRPPARFSVDYSALERAAPFVRTFVTPSNDQYFAVTLPAALNPAKPALRPLSAEVLILLDTSRTSTDLKQARLAVKTIAQNLRAEDRFQFGCVDQHFRPITKQWMSPRTSSSQKALKQLDDVFPMGGSKLDQALAESLTVFGVPFEERAEIASLKRQIVVYVGAGEATLGSPRSNWQENAVLRNAIRRIEFHGVEVSENGSAATWLRKGVRASHGRLFTVHKDAAGLRSLFEWTLAGMLSAPAVDNVQCDQSDDLFHDDVWPIGREFHIFGRCPAKSSLELKLKMVTHGEQTFQVPVEQSATNDPFAGRLWAAQKLASMLSSEDFNSPSLRPDVVQLCQEWSLISPHTAFLVLESEADFARWHITRYVRQKYWQNASSADDTLVHANLIQKAQDRYGRVTDDSVLSAALANRARVQTIPRRSLTSRQHLESAKRALAHKNASLALSHLNSISPQQRVADEKLINELTSQAQKAAQRESVLNQLRLHAPLFDRSADGPLPPISPLFMGMGPVAANPDYIERHPHFADLMKPAPKFEQEQMTVDDFARYLQKSTGIPVFVDHRCLSDEGISSGERLALDHALQGLPIQVLMDQLLSRELLAAVSQKDLIRITTQGCVDETFQEHFYSIKDFVNENAMPTAAQLAHPSLDADARKVAAIESRLKTRINMEFSDVPLNEAIERIFAALDVSVLIIDRRAMSEEGIASKKPVSVSADNVPREVVLRELLAPLFLDFVVKPDYLLVTTQPKASEMLETRVYSAAGVVDDTQDDPVPVRRRNRQGRFWWSDDFGLGGMGGGMGGANVNNATPNIAGVPQAGLSLGELRPVIESELDAVEPEEEENRFANTSASESDELRGNSSEDFVVPNSGYLSAIQLITRNVRGNWIIGGFGMRSDWDNESISFEPSSHTLVVRCTQRAHRQVKELLSKIRRSSDSIWRGMPAIAPTKFDAGFGHHRYMQLRQIIGHVVPPRSFQHSFYDPELSYHISSSLLEIGATKQGHEEIDRLLVQLRRARYLSQMIPWMHSLEGIDDMLAQFDFPTMTLLPRNSAEITPESASHQERLNLLAVRKVRQSLNQRWRHRSARDGQIKEVVVRTNGSRMELKFPDRTMRSEGQSAAIAYPGLTLVELDLWGEAVRQIADSTLPWLPHLTNDQIAREFNVAQEAETDNEVTLRLQVPCDLQTYIQVTFSKQTGLPTSSRTFLTGEFVHELRFEAKTVLAVDSGGKELDRWDLISDDPSVEIAALDQDWSPYFLVEPSKPASPILKARQQIREGNLADGRPILEGLLKHHPNQPLLNFLYAWCLKLADTSNPDERRQMREALQRVVAVGPADLMAFIRSDNFRAFGVEELDSILNAVPVEHRSEELWNALSEVAIQQGEYAAALDALDHAIIKSSDPLTQRRQQLKRVDLLVRSARPREADQLARSLVTGNPTGDEVLDLADLFARSNLADASEYYYEFYRNTPDRKRDEQIHADMRQGTAQRRNEIRWQALLNSVAELGASPELIDVIADEAMSFRDAEKLEKLSRTTDSAWIRRKLRRRQLEIESPEKRASLALQLLQDKTLSLRDVPDLAEIMTGDDRHQQIVDIIESYLKTGRRLDFQYLDLLAERYWRLGRSDEYERVESERAARLNTPSSLKGN